MPVLAEFFCLRCQRCIRDASQLRPHFRECPEADIQKIAYTTPLWQRRPIDVNQFRDWSDSSDAFHVSSNETHDNVSRPVNATYPSRHYVNRPVPQVSTPAESVSSSELESLLNEALFIPGRRKKITLGMGVRAFLTGKQMPRQNQYGILVTNPLWIGGDLYGDVGVARVIRPTYISYASHMPRLADYSLAPSAVQKLGHMNFLALAMTQYYPFYSNNELAGVKSWGITCTFEIYLNSAENER